MRQSVRAARMQRSHKRMAQESKLSLVSLMDIFTILVFFLMFNASDVQVLQSDKSVKLPESTADTAAQETLVLLVNAQHILLQGQKMANVADVIADTNPLIDALQTELEYQKGRTRMIAGPAKAAGQTNDENRADPQDIARAITIMGDKEIPYQLLKKIMQTCAQAGYTNISLAVEQQPVEGDA